MKIRSVKHTFWHSPDVQALPFEGRLLFIGLWQYVDDNGVGLDSPALLAGEVFPGEMAADPAGTVAAVDALLWDMAALGMVRRFDGEEKGSPRQLIEIPSWGKHQRIARPTKGHEYTPWREGMTVRERLVHVMHRAKTLHDIYMLIACKSHVSNKPNVCRGGGLELETALEQATPAESEATKTGRELGKRRDAEQLHADDMQVTCDSHVSDVQDAVNFSARKQEIGNRKQEINNVQNSRTVAPAENSEPVDNSQPPEPAPTLSLQAVQEPHIVFPRDTWKPTPEQIAAAHTAGLNPAELADRLRHEDTIAQPSRHRPWTERDFTDAFDDAVRKAKSRNRYEQMMARRGYKPNPADSQDPEAATEEEA